MMLQVKLDGEAYTYSRQLENSSCRHNRQVFILDFGVEGSLFTTWGWVEVGPLSDVERPGTPDPHDYHVIPLFTYQPSTLHGGIDGAVRQQQYICLAHAAAERVHAVRQCHCKLSKLASADIKPSGTLLLLSHWAATKQLARQGTSNTCASSLATKQL